MGDFGWPSGSDKLEILFYTKPPTVKAKIYQLDEMPSSRVIKGEVATSIPENKLSVNVSFFDEGPPRMWKIPIKKVEDSEIGIYFTFELSIRDVPKFSPQDSKYKATFFEFMVTDQAGNTYYHKLSYAQFMAPGNYEFGINDLVDINFKKSYEGIYNQMKLSCNVIPNSCLIKQLPNGKPAIELKVTGSTKNMRYLEWKNNTEKVKPLTLIYRDEKKIAFSFSNNYVDRDVLKNKKVTYRVEQEDKDLNTYSSDIIKLNLLDQNIPKPLPEESAPPEGFLDTADCQLLMGWGRDPDTNSSIKIHIYADGEAGTHNGKFIGEIFADRYRADLCNFWGNGDLDCYHGFEFPIPDKLKNGISHTIFVYAIDNQNIKANNRLIKNCPISLHKCERIQPKVKVGEGQVVISWNSVSDSSSFNIYWSKIEGITKATGKKISNVTSPYLHKGLKNGDSYYYIITAEDKFGEGSASEVVSAIPGVWTGNDITLKYNGKCMIRNILTHLTPEVTSEVISAIKNGRIGFCLIGDFSGWKTGTIRYPITYKNDSLLMDFTDIPFLHGIPNRFNIILCDLDTKELLQYYLWCNHFSSVDKEIFIRVTSQDPKTGKGDICMAIVPKNGIYRPVRVNEPVISR